jgi:hypothetical protein
VSEVFRPFQAGGMPAGRDNVNRKSERILKKDRILYGRRSLQLAAGIFNTVTLS